ncbi:MAG: alanine racemase [Muribaculaceae bacterium]|nr:alanine racemase [Muribaculaceae bacterium]
MTGFTPKEIKQILGTDSEIIVDGDLTIDQFLIDSRSLTKPDRSIFFAISTDNNDGHRYIADLVSCGVKNFVVTDSSVVPDGVNCYCVDNVVETLQKLAAYHRQHFNPDLKVVAVTGSRGKTRVKEWLSALLPGCVCRSMRSFNSQTGVALSLLNVDTTADYAVIESGISREGEMSRLESMLKPDMVVVTNVTDEHKSGFESREKHIAEKLILVKNAKEVVFHKLMNDGGLTDVILEAICSDRLVYWDDSQHDKNAFLVETDRMTDAGITYLSYKYNGRDSKCKTVLTNRYDIDNALTALTAVHKLVPRFTPPEILPFEDITTRIDVVNGLNGMIIIHDRFSNDALSLRGALDFARRRITENREMVLIVADSILKDNFNPVQLEELAKEYGVSEVIVAKSYSDFIDRYKAQDFAGKIVLVKGGAKDRFDRIVSLLEQKQHETCLEVNLDNLVSNFNFFKSKVDRSTGVVVMLKANGYGCGSLELAKTLQAQGASAIAVAVIDEGIELRRAGVTMPIIVLNPRADNYDLMFEYRLEPEVYGIDILERIISKANKAGIKNFPIHLKMDTGMHRLGFSYDNLPQVCDIINKNGAVKVASVFSHLATADCFDKDDYTESQLSLFDRSVKYLRANLKDNFKSHILNTAGIMRFTAHQHEMVRLGIGLYGLPILNDGSEAGLKPVASLYTTIIAIANRHQGDTIGYSRRGVIDGDRIIATLPIGYADGIDRRLGNGNITFRVNGVDCKTVGNICMDLCMIDVTDANAKVGDRVEIFGSEVDICKIADKLGTIPYEILTSISDRVKRIYYRE